MVSFEIQNIFPFIPLTDVIFNAADILMNKLGNLLRDELITLLKFLQRMFHLRSKIYFMNTNKELQ